MFGAVSYRVGQFVRALSARHVVSQERVQKATETLSPEAQALFAQQGLPDQRHALAVYETLCERGHTSEDLLAAALLHDVGKAVAHLRPWERGLLVLAERFAPRSLDSLTGAAPGPIWEPLAQYVRHPEIGASWARNAGCSHVTVELIRRHEDSRVTRQAEEDPLLSALQAADNAN